MSVRLLAGDILLMLLHLIFIEGKYQYPPDLADSAVELVLQKAEALGRVMDKSRTRALLSLISPMFAKLTLSTALVLKNSPGC